MNPDPPERGPRLIGECVDEWLATRPDLEARLFAASFFAPPEDPAPPADAGAPEVQIPEDEALVAADN